MESSICTVTYVHNIRNTCHTALFLHSHILDHVLARYKQIVMNTAASHVHSFPTTCDAASVLSHPCAHLHVVHVHVPLSGRYYSNGFSPSFASTSTLLRSWQDGQHATPSHCQSKVGSSQQLVRHRITSGSLSSTEPSAHELTASSVLRTGQDQDLHSVGKALSTFLLYMLAAIHACNDRQGTWQL